MKKFILVLLFATVPATVNAFTGADLLAQCNNFIQILDGAQPEIQPTLEAGLCGGYVLGVQEGFLASTELVNIASKEQGMESMARNYWKIPPDIEAEKIVRIVVRYLELNPEAQKEPAVLSVINALRQTYPVK
jgi:hypothetical protein